MAQKLPATLEERIQAFYRQIKGETEINKFGVVGNMDETPLYFDVVPGMVLNKKGKQSLVVVPQEIKSDIWLLSLDSVVLLALAIFKGKKHPKIHEVGVFIRVQEKAREDETMMMEWIDLVIWEQATEGRRALLILDSLSAHITMAIKQKLKEINTVPVVIPGGCTSKVQPLDMNLNKPFIATGLAISLSSLPIFRPRSWNLLKKRMLLAGFRLPQRSCKINQTLLYDLLRLQLYPDSADELDNPFNDTETLMSDCDYNVSFMYYIILIL